MRARKFWTTIFVIIGLVASGYVLCMNETETARAAATQGPTNYGKLPQSCDLTASPNPFRVSAQISYTVFTRAKVTLSVNDITGRCVATLVDGVVKEPRRYRIIYRPETRAGVYFVHLRVGDTIAETKIVHIK